MIGGRKLLSAATWLLAALAFIGFVFWAAIMVLIREPGSVDSLTVLIGVWAAAGVLVSGLGLFALSRGKLLWFRISGIAAFLMALPFLGLRGWWTLWLAPAIYVDAVLLTAFAPRGPVVSQRQGAQ